MQPINARDSGRSLVEQEWDTELPQRLLGTEFGAADLSSVAEREIEEATHNTQDRVTPKLHNLVAE